jgi:hypothetical protein
MKFDMPCRTVCRYILMHGLNNLLQIGPRAKRGQKRASAASQMKLQVDRVCHNVLGTYMFGNARGK